MRVAYVVCSYTLPEQVVRLLRLLRDGSPGAILVSHHDDRRSELDAAALADLGVVRVLPPTPVTWGSYSQLDMVLRCMRVVLEQPGCDWLVLLSGQDYPIRRVRDVEAFLAADGHDAFIERRELGWRPQVGRTDEWTGRYFRRWSTVRPRLVAPARAVAARSRGLVELRTLPSGTVVAGRPALRTPYAPGRSCFQGSDWFTLSRRCAELVCGADPSLLRHYRRTLVPTESFVHTVLHNEPSLRLSGDTRRFTRWDLSPAPRPRTLRTADLEAMLASGLDFARKFDERVDADVLDELDRRVHRPPG